MRLTDLTIKDLLTEDDKLTFLIGAGCSVDVPSCLSAGREMIEAIIRHTCAESEIETVLGLKQLRFEQLVGIIQETLDRELKIIDYYGECNKPNHQHFFLADMIKKGQFVMTTNFDFLIEYALLQSNVSEEEIVPVITKEDFEYYNNPEKFSKQGKKTLYKIHGSTQNIITGEDTRNSLVATIQAFGSNKEGLNVFQLEPFKQPLFENISNGRSLVVMGYSGSDDFDVVPTLMVLKNLKNFIWINYTPDNDKEKIYKIDVTFLDKTKRMNKVNQILVDIYRMRNASHIYKVDVNTSRLIEKLSDTTPSINLDSFSLNLKNWLENNVKIPLEMVKYYVPYRIYSDFSMYKDALRCIEIIFHLSEKEQDKKLLAATLSSIGDINYNQGNLLEALKMQKKALKIARNLGDRSGEAIYLNKIGMVYFEQGNDSKALKIYNKALKIALNLRDYLTKTKCLSNIGTIYKSRRDYSKALEKYEEALKYAEDSGNLSLKSIEFNNIGEIYRAQGNFSEALKRHEESLKINEQLGDLKEEAISLINIGMNYDEQGDYLKARKRYKKANKIYKQLGIPIGEANSLNNIGLTYFWQGNYPEAVIYFEEALRLLKEYGLSDSPYTKIFNENLEKAKGNLD